MPRAQRDLNSTKSSSSSPAVRMFPKFSLPLHVNDCEHMPHGLLSAPSCITVPANHEVGLLKLKLVWQKHTY